MMTATTTTNAAATTNATTAMALAEEAGVAVAAAAADTLTRAYCPWAGTLDAWKDVVESSRDVWNHSHHDWDERNWTNCGVAAYFNALAGTTIPAEALSALTECLRGMDTDYFLGADGELDV